jgi:hypothetical protein
MQDVVTVRNGVIGLVLALVAWAGGQLHTASVVQASTDQRITAIERLLDESRKEQRLMRESYDRLGLILERQTVKIESHDHAIDSIRDDVRDARAGIRR